MTLPDGDGIECSREILKHVKDAKIIAISSMMDQEIIKKATDVGIKAYLQKPVNQNELNASVQRLFEGEALYIILMDKFEDAFKESIFSFLKREIGGEITIENNPTNSDSIRKSSGISVTIGIIGRHNGRCIIDMSDDTSMNMTKKILQDDSESIENAIAFLSEFTNIVTGNACSLLNGLNRSFGLRVSPSTVFRGNDICISIGDILSKSYIIKTDYGDVFMNAGFQKVGTEWILK